MEVFDAICQADAPDLAEESGIILVQLQFCHVADEAVDVFHELSVYGTTFLHQMSNSSQHTSLFVDFLGEIDVWNSTRDDIAQALEDQVKCLDVKLLIFVI